jgi:hypothetical protein
MNSHPRLLASESEILGKSITDSQLPSERALQLAANPRPFEEILRTGPSGADQVVIDTTVSLLWIAAAWRVTRKESYRELLRPWLAVLKSHPPMKIPKFAFGNRDLMVGHLLLSLALMDDLLRDVFDAEFEQALRQALVSQARQAHADLTNPEAFPSYSYEQNHMIIPICGLGLAAMDLGDDEKASGAWAAFAREFLEKSFDVLAKDGWFFEGVGYWCFTMQFPICYATALKRTTGERLFTKPIFNYAGQYLAHNVLPDSRFVFDFADWGPRLHHDGIGFQFGYDLPWHTLPTYLLRSLLLLLAHEQKEPFWSDFLQRLPKSSVANPIDGTFQLLAPESPTNRDAATAATLPTSHYFPDMEVLHWRSSWNDPAATALAFKSGPPAGHYLGSLLSQHPEWHLELGHAHPDAGSFLLFSQGAFLANDTGYTGKKETADHNSILVDGIGQHKGGTPWSTFAAKPYAEYDKIHLENVWHTPQVAAATAVFEAAYDDALQLREMRRHLILVDGRFLVIRDVIRSALPHEYEWRLHSDQAARTVNVNRFVMENGPGRLIVENLNSIASHEIAPTIVETELYDPARTRPQQRGFHLSLKSPVGPDFQFLVAIGIQSTTAKPEDFSATWSGGELIELRDSAGSCSVWIGRNAAGRDVFSYCLRGHNRAVQTCASSSGELPPGFSA